MKEDLKNNQSIVNLFGCLSTYYKHENDLSNVTVALCNSNIEFLRLFVHFFFPKVRIGEIVSVEREKWDNKDGSSRVDIMINLKNDYYLIEVKIDDDHHHFGQYEEDFDIDKKHLGYIVNYELSKVGYEIKQWKQFYYYLKEKILEVDDEVHVSMIYGYMQYLKNLCRFTDYEKPMNLNYLQSLHQFFDIASNILSFSTNTYCVTVCRLSSPVSNNSLAPYMCLSFTIQYDDSRRKEIPMYLYLYFRDSIEIFISVNPNVNPRLAQKLSNAEVKHRGKYFEDGFLDTDGWYESFTHMWFKMKQQDKFLNSQILQEQERLLSQYIKDVIEYCANCYES